MMSGIVLPICHGFDREHLFAELQHKHSAVRLFFRHL
jgi:hypothetical protein